MATTQETAYQIGLAQARSAASSSFDNEETPEKDAATQQPLQSAMGGDDENEEEEDRPMSITEGVKHALRTLRASRAKTAEKEEAPDATNILISEATYALLRPVWIDIFATIGIASFGLSWLVLGAYTFVVDALNVFGFNKQEGALGALTDPIDAAIGMRRSIRDDVPEFMKTSYRLMGRAFVIYPISFLVATIYSALLVLIAIIAYSAIHPTEAIKLFGTSLL